MIGCWSFKKGLKSSHQFPSYNSQPRLCASHCLCVCLSVCLSVTTLCVILRPHVSHCLPVTQLFCLSVTTLCMGSRLCYIICLLICLSVLFLSFRTLCMGASCVTLLVCLSVTTLYLLVCHIVCLSQHFVMEDSCICPCFDKNHMNNLCVCLSDIRSSVSPMEEQKQTGNVFASPIWTPEVNR